MTISLPLLWLCGHLAAAPGAGAFLLHVLTGNRMVFIISSAGGAIACLALFFILMTTGKSFFGIYSVLAWVIAFFAGYAVAAPVGYAVRFGKRIKVAHS